MRASVDIRYSTFGMCHVPPKGNANFSRVQHFFNHFAPQGMAGFVLSNYGIICSQSGEGDILHALIEADLVD